jgi:hypothetical protein
MSVARLVLDYLRLLLWPALILFVLWKFGARLQGMFVNSRINRVKALGLEVEWEQVKEVLQENLQQTREELAKAEDPAERQRAAEKLERETRALTWVRAAKMASTSSMADPVPEAIEYDRQLVGEALDRGLSQADVDHLSHAFYGLLDEARRHGLSLSEAVQQQRAMYGSPEQVVDAYIRAKTRGDIGRPSPSDRVDDESG